MSTPFRIDALARLERGQVAGRSGERRPDQLVELGHVALGRPTVRDRSAEFSTTATVAQLHELVGGTLATAVDDIGALEAGKGVDTGGRQSLVDGDTSDASVVIHVLEEAFQHLGHMELAADALLADQPPASA